MAISCTSADLLAASKCLCGIPSGKRELVMIYLLQQLAGLGNLTADQLLDRAKCLCGLSEHDMKAIEVALLCAATGGVPPCPPCPPSGGCTYQDMQVAWTPTSTKLGEHIGFFSFGDMGLPGPTPITFDHAIAVAGYDIEGDANVTELHWPNLVSIDLGNLQGGYIALSGLSALTTVSFASLVATGADFGITGAPLLTSFSAPLLATIGTTIGINSTGLAALSLPSLATVGSQLSLSSNNNLVSISLPALITVTSTFSGNNCPLLTTVSAPLWVPTDGTTINFNACALSATSVQQILRRCVLAGVTTCTIILDGGTSAGTASLNAQGQADVATLGGQLTINP